MNNFTLDTRVLGEVAVVHPYGYLNNIVAEKLEKECAGLLKKGVSKIVLNFNDIEYINSIGISILLGMLEGIKGTGGELFFSNLSELHDETFETIGLKMYMKIYKSEDDALAHLKGSAG
jgi:anti-sigma B factor antagonist